MSSKLRGFYQYYGVRTNYKALETVFEYAEKAWRYWLSKRSQRSNVQMADLRGKYPYNHPFKIIFSTKGRYVPIQGYGMEHMLL